MSCPDTHDKTVSEHRPVLLIRPDGNDRDAAALAACGLASTIDPWLVTQPADDLSAARRFTGMLVGAGPHVALIITSPRTWGYLEQLAGAKALQVAAHAAVSRDLHVYCTGKSTVDSLPQVLADRAAVAPNAKALVRLLNNEVIDQINETVLPKMPPLALLPGSQIARPELADGLQAGGWRVFQAPVYTTKPRGDHPASADALANGRFSAVVLRSPSAFDALTTIMGDAPVPASTRIIAGGPTTTAAAQAAGLDVIACPSPTPLAIAQLLADEINGVGSQIDSEPNRPAPQTGGHAFAQAATTAAAGDHQLPANHPLRTGSLSDSAFLAACRGERPARTPVWFMRQAGRSLPEYRKAREGSTMLESCLNPELAAELTMQPVRRYGVDAAIFYSDIMVPLKLAGVDVEIAPGVGPVIASPVRTMSDVEALPELSDDALQPIRDAVGLVADQLGTTPLIGFAGAPYTVASYLIEGRPNPQRDLTHQMMHDDPQTFAALLDWVATIDLAFLRAQVIAGASAVQLFDSWVGELSLSDYLVHAQPASGLIMSGIAPLGVPRIHFGTQTGDLLVAMRDAGADVIGVAADTSLARAHELLGDTPLQGNIDPAMLGAPGDQLDAHIDHILDQGRLAPAHIVNLAHGVPKDADPAALAHIVERVHASTEGH